MPDKDYLEQLIEDRELLDKLTMSITITTPTSLAIHRAIDRLDKEIKTTKQLRRY